MPSGVYVRPENFKEVRREIMLNYWRDPKKGKHRREMMSKKMKGRLALWMIGKKLPEHSKFMKAKWQNPEWRKKKIEGTIKAVNRLDVKKKNREAQIEKWKDPDYRKKMHKKLSKAQKKLWQNPQHKENQRKAQMIGKKVKPNKPELKLNNILQRIFPNDYKYVGDGEFILAGKCPDFVNVNGQKKIIEMFGDYWHKGETGEERITLFKQYGYDTLIVWENELKDENILKEKLLDFHNKEKKNAHYT